MATNSETKKNGRKSIPPLERMTKKDVVAAASSLFAMSALTSRLQFARQAGMQFEGDRDLYQVFGWKKEPDFETYKALYDRNGIARRVVEIVADETWRKDPVILDGEVKSNNPDETQLTPFLTAYKAIVEKHGVYHHFRNADINCGIGRWSLIYMGMAGDQDLAAPLRKNATKDLGNGFSEVVPQRLLYITTFDEGQVPEFKEIDKEMSSARYGMPVIYKVYPDGKKDMLKEKLVHHTRVLHIAENTRRSRVVGVPRLQAVLNTMFDLEKVAGSAAEAFWMSVYQGFAFGLKDDYELPGAGTADYSDLEEQIEAFTHKLTRYIFAEGLDEVKPIKADVVSPDAQFKMVISQISGATGIPQRILIGSERGELASDQDDKNFADATDVRRTKFAEVQFIRPFVDFLLENNLIPQPASGNYKVEHQSLFELNEVEKADVAYKVAQSIYVLTRNNPNAANAIPIDQFMKKYLGFAIDLPKGTPPEKPGQKPGNEQPPKQEAADA